MWENAHTIADGLRVPKAIGDFLVLRAVRESQGAAVPVGDAEMVAGMKDLGAYEGVSAAPEGGAALHAVRVLTNEGRIKPHDTVVIFNTGGALKYLDVLEPS
jgi:threonine synthase